MKKIIIAIILISVAIFSGYQLGVKHSFEQYPWILTSVNPPFESEMFTTSSFDNQNSVSLATFGTDAEEQYLYLHVNVNCSPIEIYALDDDQSAADTEPYDVIPAQNVDCKQAGSFTTYEQLVPNKAIEIRSDSPITGAYYVAIEGDYDE